METRTQQLEAQNSARVVPESQLKVGSNSPPLQLMAPESFP